MYRSPIGLLLAAALSILTASSTPVARAQDDETKIRVVTPSNPVDRSNTPIDISIEIANVADLGGFQFILVVDPNVLKPVGVRETTFLGSSGRQVVCQNPTIEDAAIRFSCVTLRAEPTGVSGSGTIAIVSLQPRSSGQSDLALKKTKLVHPDGTELAATTEDARLSVAGDSWWTRTHMLEVAGAVTFAVVAVLGTIRLLSHRKGRYAASESETAERA